MKITNSLLHIKEVVRDKDSIFDLIKKNAFNLITDEVMTRAECQEWIDHLNSNKRPFVLLEVFTKNPKTEGYAILTDMKKFYTAEKYSEGNDIGVSDEQEQSAPSKVLEIEDLEMFEDSNNV